MDLVLASGSPRRRELLARLGLTYRVTAADVDESPRPGEAPAALAARLAEAKARRVAEKAPDVLIVAADTVVARGRTLYGKPGHAAEARAMLRELANRVHRVITGVALGRGRSIEVATLASRVRMRALSDVDIEEYIATGDPFDKAGGYAIQHEEFRPVASLGGCRCNVVGFPVGLVAHMLEASGMHPPVSPAAACLYGCYAPERCLPA